MKIKTRSYDSSNYLDSDKSIAAYLEEAVASGDSATIAYALGTVARAKGMSHVAKEAGLSREHLYRALSKEGNPEFATVVKVAEALGLRFAVEPATPKVNSKAATAASSR
jgi:probable addiction module antidote protein